MIRKCIIIVFLAWCCFIQAKELRLCQEAVTELPNLDIYHINGQTYAGQSAAVVAQALVELNIPFKVTRVPWKRCIADGGNGTFDGVIGIGWTAERDKMFVYPKLSEQQVAPELRLQYANYSVYTLKEQKVTWDGARFEHVQFGFAAPKGFLVEGQLKQMGMLQETVVGIDRGIELLLSKRIDGLIIPDENGDKMLLADPARRFKKLQPVFFRQPLFLVFNRKQQQLNPAEIDKIWQQIAKSRALYLQPEQ